MSFCKTLDIMLYNSKNLQPGTPVIEYTAHWCHSTSIYSVTPYISACTAIYATGPQRSGSEAPHWLCVVRRPLWSLRSHVDRSARALWPLPLAPVASGPRDSRPPTGLARRGLPSASAISLCTSSLTISTSYVNHNIRSITILVLTLL